MKPADSKPDGSVNDCPATPVPDRPTWTVRTGTFLRRALWRVLVIGTPIYLLYVGVMYATQRHVMFPGRHRPAAEMPQLSMQEVLWIETDGGKAEVWYLPPVSKVALTESAILANAAPGESTEVVSAPLVIYFHGNGELIDDWPGELTRYRTLGCGVALVEYPDYGRSTGEPSEAAITEVAVAAYDRLTQLASVDKTRVVAHGRSMGGGAACALARQRPLAALILESTYTSLCDMAGRYGLPGFLCSEPFDNLSTVREWRQPLLIMHGVKDWTVPYSHGAALADANPQATFITWPERGHNGHPPNIAAAWPDIATFLQSAGVIDR